MKLFFLIGPDISRERFQVSRRRRAPRARAERPKAKVAPLHPAKAGWGRGLENPSR